MLGGEKSPSCASVIYGSVSSRVGNDGCSGCAAIKGKVQGLAGPFESLVFPHEWRLEQNKDPQSDIVTAEDALRLRQTVPGSSACSASRGSADALSPNPWRLPGSLRQGR